MGPSHGAISIFLIVLMESLVLLRIAIEVLNDVIIRRCASSREDIEALRRARPDLASAPLDELAVAVIHAELEKRQSRTKQAGKCPDRSE